MKTSLDVNIQFINDLENALKQCRKFIQSGLNKRGFDITIDQWQVLHIIKNNKNIKQTEVAAKAYKDAASVSRIIDLLNKKTYVARQVDPNNRRRIVLGISERGEKVYVKAGEIIVEFTNKTLIGFKEKRIKKIRKVFKGISKNCK